MLTPRQFREVLDSAGLSKDQAAKRLGVCTRTIYRWLTGDTIISPAFAALIEKRIPESRKVMA